MKGEGVKDEKKNTFHVAIYYVYLSSSTSYPG